jgi:hypothetical protein
MKIIDHKDAINRRLYKGLFIVKTAIYRVSCLNRTVLTLTLEGWGYTDKACLRRLKTKACLRRLKISPTPFLTDNLGFEHRAISLLDAGNGLIETQKIDDLPVYALGWGHLTDKVMLDVMLELRLM